jgi:hypothetical protein
MQLSDYISMVGQLITIVSILFVSRQVAAAIRANKNDAYGDLYNQQNAIHQYFLTNTKFLPYFFDRQELKPDHPKYSELNREIEITAEMVVDFFEHIYLKLQILPDSVIDGWVNYMAARYESSPAVKRHLDVNGGMYSQNILKLCKKEINPRDIDWSKGT